MFSSFCFCFRLKKPKPKISETTTCAEAETIGSIDDLLFQILVHLPTKPLIRFKLVSKHWNSIISDPKLHFTRNHNRAVGLIFQNIVPPEETRVVSLDRSSSNPLPQIQIPNTLRIFHSCNGLLVLKSTAAPKYDEFYVYNPTTKQITTNLARDDEKAGAPETIHGMYLAFDPSMSPHYKLVCVWEKGYRCLNKDIMHLYQFEVYSSETGSWEKRCVWFSEYVDFYSGVYWNGAIHWLNKNNGKSIFFNPDNDEMPHVMPHPPIHEGSPGYYFGESCGHLHYAFFDGAHQLPPGISVYEMRRDYSEWFLKFRVDGEYCLRYYTVRYLYSVVRGKKDEDSFLVFGTDKEEIIRYNLVHNTCQDIQVKDFEFDNDLNYLVNSFQYIESLCSV